MKLNYKTFIRQLKHHDLDVGDVPVHVETADLLGDGAIYIDFTVAGHHYSNLITPPPVVLDNGYGKKKYAEIDADQQLDVIEHIILGIHADYSGLIERTKNDPDLESDTHRHIKQLIQEVSDMHNGRLYHGL